MRFGTVVILALGLTLVGCVAEPDPVAREWHAAGPFPSRMFDCVFEPTQEALAATDAGLVFAFAGPEHAEISSCVQEADGPGSVGSDDRVEGADGPVAVVFVSVYESERIMALQRLSSGADAVGSLAIDGLVAGGDEIGLLTRSGVPSLSINPGIEVAPGTPRSISASSHLGRLADSSGHREASES